MPKGFTADIDAQDMAAFQKGLRAVEGSSRKSIKGVVMMGSIMFCRAARKRTLMGAKKRPIIDNPAFDKSKRGRGRGAKYLIVRQTQKGISYLPTSNKRDKRTRIADRGLAQSSWSWLLSKLGKSGAGTSAASGKGKRFVRATKQLSGINPQVTLLNNLNYITTIAPGVVSQSLASAGKQMLKAAERNLQKAISKA